MWKRLGTDLKPHGLLQSIAVETGLDGVAAVTEQILAGQVRGRTLVHLGAE